ncbi:MAG: ECF transporter S component [Clostridiales bacterium]|nr:ECF transporter S component [Clostridiales bacterium]
MSKQNRNSKTKTIALLGILTGLIILMAFTPVGYLRVGVVSISFLMIPVAIGSLAKGPLAGAALGTVFGITSFIQCFGMDAFGTYLASKNVFFTFIMCIVCRALAGLCAGFIYKLITKLTKNVVVRSSLTGLSAALFNTIFFVSALILLFGKTVVSEATGLSAELTFFALFGAIVGINAIFEAIASFIVTGAVGTALFKAKLIED